MRCLVERVARAIAEADGGEGAPILPEDRLLARAAMQAMREISIAEKAPGVSAYVKMAGTCRPVAIKAAWEAIIDDALSNTGEQT